MSNVNYPGNSDKGRKEVEPVKGERPKLERITSAPGVVRKPSLGSRIKETFTGDSARSTGDFVLFEVVIPTLKTLIYDTFTQGLDRTLFGGRPITRNATSGGSRVNYNGISTQKAAQQRYPGRNFEGDGGSPRSISNQARANHQFDEIVLPSRGDAEMVLDTLTDMVSRYEWASVSAFYELVGITGSFTDEKWGWSNLASASIRPVRNGFVILLPSPEYDN